MDELPMVGPLVDVYLGFVAKALRSSPLISDLFDIVLCLRGVRYQTGIQPGLELARSRWNDRSGHIHHYQLVS